MELSCGETWTLGHQAYDLTGIILKFKAGTVSYQDYLRQEDT